MGIHAAWVGPSPSGSAYHLAVDAPTPQFRRLVIIGGLAAAIAVFAAAVLIYANNPDPNGLPVAIQSVSPQPNDEVLRQADITVDLAVGYTAELTINGIPIPEEELFRVPALNQLTYEPGSLKTIQTLLPDRNCATVTYWLIAGSQADANSYDWCFESS